MGIYGLISGKFGLQLAETILCYHRRACARFSAGRGSRLGLQSSILLQSFTLSPIFKWFNPQHNCRRRAGDASPTPVVGHTLIEIF